MELLMRLLSGTTTLAPPQGRAGLSILMVMRLTALAVGDRSHWLDETGDLVCNSTTSCRLACFDSVFPVSPFTFFLLQTAFVSMHCLVCGLAGLLLGCLRNKTQQLLFHLLIVLSRILLESFFLMTFYTFYVRYPQILQCPASTLCPGTVVCTIHYTQWKDAFDLFVSGTSWASMGVCLMVLYFAVTETVQLTWWPANSPLGHPLLVETA